MKEDRQYYQLIIIIFFIAICVLYSIVSFALFVLDHVEIKLN